MLSVAQKLLATMPVIHCHGWHDDRWGDWLHRHTLSRTDGRWLADRRDLPPLEQRHWLHEERTNDWQWEITPYDFLEGLFSEKGGKTWINVSGYWNECDSSRNETYNISSAFVDTKTSSSLLRALTTSRDPREYKLPDYQEEDMEFHNPPFNLEGWICDPDNDKRLDEKDPRAGDISYPTLCIGENFCKKFDLKPDLEKRIWRDGSTPPKKCFESQVWGNKEKDTRSESFVRHGQRLSGSLAMLKKMCKKLRKDMIIEVQIARSLSDIYNRDKDDSVRYPPPYSKVYLLKGDGIFRDTTTSYQLREETG